MPAVTVENPLSLPGIAVPPAATSRWRPVLSVTSAPSAFEGEGFPVRRAFAGVDRRRLDPFIHMDQMGEVDYGPGEPRGTSWHPHRGFETVTYMIDGAFQHQDSTGGGGLITNGATQWMTAGAGILHIERPPEALVASGGLFHGVQLWVNLPAAEKMVPARYQDIGADHVTLASSPDGGALVRVIAGAVGGAQGPGRTHTPISVVHASLTPGAELRLPWRADFNALVYALAGRGTVGTGKRPLTAGQLAVFGAGDALVMAADRTQDGRSSTLESSTLESSTLELYILGGRPIGEPIATYGPFVMNTQAELAQAFDDFRTGRMGVIPADHIGV